MTLKDFLDRVSIDDLDKMILSVELVGKSDVGWSNIGIQNGKNEINIFKDYNSPFSEEINDISFSSSLPKEDSIYKVLKEKGCLR